jgi:hypothetical protein
MPVAASSAIVLPRQAATARVASTADVALDSDRRRRSLLVNACASLDLQPLMTWVRARKPRSRHGRTTLLGAIDS